MTEALPDRPIVADEPRLLVTDLDGTLLDPDGRIHEADRQAVAALQAAGVPVTFATGRAWPTARAVAAALGLRTPVVVYNGAQVVSPTGKVLHARWLPRRAVELAEALARRHGLGGFAYLPDRLVPLADGAAFVDYLLPEDRAMVRPDGSGRAFDGSAPSNRAAIKLLFLGPDGACDAFEAACRAYGHLLRPVRSGRQCVEVLPAGVSKATGLAFVLERLGLRPSQVVAVGDGLNDLEMLQLAGRPVAVAGAEPALLQRARFVAPAPPDAPLAAVARTFFPHARAAGLPGAGGPLLTRPLPKAAPRSAWPAGSP